MRVSGCYTHEAPVGHSICDLSRIIATRQLDTFTVPSSHHISNNCIYVRSHLFAGRDSIVIDLMTMEDWLFSQHRPPTILPFLLVGRCDCRWLRNDFSIPRAPENICPIKKHHYTPAQRSWKGVILECSCLPQRNKTAVVISVYWNNKHTSTKMTKHLAKLGRSCAAAPGVCGAGPHDTASQEVPMIKIRPVSKWNTLL